MAVAERRQHLAEDGVKALPIRRGDGQRPEMIACLLPIRAGARMVPIFLLDQTPGTIEHSALERWGVGGNGGRGVSGEKQDDQERAFHWRSNAQASVRVRGTAV